MKHIKLFEHFVNEAKSSFQVYHNQYSTAIDEVEKVYQCNGI